MRGIIPLIIAALLIAGALPAYYFSDSQVKKRALQQAFKQVDMMIATKDRIQVSSALNDFLTDDAKVRLEVRFFAIGNQPPVLEQKFDKVQFITFIDNILYSLSDYASSTQLATVDAKENNLHFTSHDWGDGANMMGGVSINMRYSITAECKSEARFENKTAALSNIDCKVTMSQLPKPGQEGKLLNRGNLMEMLQK